MKKFRYFLLIVLVLPICFLCFGCTKEVTVVNIEKTGFGTDYEIYTVYYSNGKTSTITITPGKDGKDGQDLNLDQLFENCVAAGLYENTVEGKKQFLQDYITNHIDTTDVVNNLMNSAVVIYSAFPLMNVNYSVASGSGVIWKIGENKSYIVTNCHVIANYISSAANKLPIDIAVYLYGADIRAQVGSNVRSYDFSNSISATCVGYSANDDIALLELNTEKLLELNSNACDVQVADKRCLAEEVYAIGNPCAEGFSVTHGIISVYSEDVYIAEFPLDNRGRTFNVMRIDVPIYSGNSGGGLFNKQGQLVGIVNAGADIGDNYNYALPIENVKETVKNLISMHEAGHNSFN